MSSILPFLAYTVPRPPLGPVLLGLALALALAGCGGTAPASSGDRAAAARAAEAFNADVRAKHGQAACDLLTEDARSGVESFDASCPDQITKLDPVQGQPRQVQVFVDAAQVKFDGDTVFLDRFPSGWRVSAAGCQLQQGKPYDCEVGG